MAEIFYIVICEETKDEFLFLSREEAEAKKAKKKDKKKK